MLFLLLPRSIGGDYQSEGFPKRFRNKGVIRRSQQFRFYLDEAHETLETVKVQRQTYLLKKVLSLLQQVTLQDAIKIHRYTLRMRLPLRRNLNTRSPRRE